jgi:hypothetical protein
MVRTQARSSGRIGGNTFASKRMDIIQKKTYDRNDIAPSTPSVYIAVQPVPLPPVYYAPVAYSGSLNIAALLFSIIVTWIVYIVLQKSNKK